MTLFEILDIMAIHNKIMDLYGMAKDLEGKNGIKFTVRSRKLIHEIAVMCNNCVSIKKYTEKEKAKETREKCLESREPEDIILNMIIAIVEGAEKGDRALTYITPMICIPLIDEMLEQRDKAIARNNKS